MEVIVYKTVKKIPFSQKRVEKIVSHVLHALKYTDVSVSIHFVGTQKIKTMNNTYRGKDYATDVLSFGTTEQKPKNGDDLGDIFICVPVIARQAREWDVPYTEELIRMMVHGILHLLHFDHDTTKKAKIMFGYQEKFVEALV